MARGNLRNGGNSQQADLPLSRFSGASQTLSFRSRAHCGSLDYRVVGRVDNLRWGRSYRGWFLVAHRHAPGSSPRIRRSAIGGRDIVVTRTDYSRATLADQQSATIPTGESFTVDRRQRSLLTPSDGITTWCCWLFRSCRWSHRQRAPLKLSSIGWAVGAYLQARFRCAAFSRFMVPPPTEFQISFPLLAHALEETSFLAF